jgi:8-oxo-dGTP pyrophosphatase MutT (NUDIX family)
VAVKESLRRVLAEYQPLPIEPEPGLWQAAVLVPIYFGSDGRPHVVFQKRTDRVEAHKGQVSFPGGRRDPEDPHLLHTALRETHEEIGVDPAHVEVFGEIDQIRTISNFVVTPYVGWLDRYPYEWRFSEHEVAYLLEVPVDHLLDPVNFVPDRRQVGGREIVMPSYRWRDDLIWGATGRMLTNFLDLWNAARTG